MTESRRATDRRRVSATSPGSRSTAGGMHPIATGRSVNRRTGRGSMWCSTTSRRMATAAPASGMDPTAATCRMTATSATSAGCRMATTTSASANPAAAAEAAGIEVGRTESEGKTTGDGDFPGRAFHDGVLE